MCLAISNKHHECLGWPWIFFVSRRVVDVLKVRVELRQYKNDSIWSKDKLALNLPHFFTRLYGQWKRAANSKLICLWTKWCRSYFVFTLAVLQYLKSCVTQFRQLGTKKTVFVYIWTARSQTADVLAFTAIELHICFESSFIFLQHFDEKQFFLTVNLGKTFT